MDRIEEPDGRVIKIGVYDSPVIFHRIREKKAEQEVLGLVSPFLKIGIVTQVLILIIGLVVYRNLVFPLFHDRDLYFGNVVSILAFFGLMVYLALWQARKLRHELVEIYFEEGMTKRGKIEEVMRRSFFYLAFTSIIGSSCFLMRFGFIFLEF